MRARLLRALALESERGYGEERTEGEEAERRREGMMKRTRRRRPRIKKTPGAVRRHDAGLVKRTKSREGGN